MTPDMIFNIHLVLGYAAWLLCFRAYILPRFQTVDRVSVHRAIASLHSFRFFGLVFLLPGIVGSNLPTGFATFAAYGDLATGVLAMLALLTIRIRPIFWSSVIAFNLAGLIDLIVDYYHAIRVGLLPGELGATYAIPVLYVPILMITHLAALYWFFRPQSKADQRMVSEAFASRA